jgi:alcohol dehydrogenase, propanol-preferring
MKAAVLTGFGEPLLVDDVPVPEIGADEVLIQVEACGVCHSDLHIAHGDTAAFKAITKPRLVLGHEVVGKVAKKGDAVSELDVGDRVGVPWQYSTCGSCEPCREGLENLCRKSVITGLMVDGGYAEFMRAKAAHALRVPEGLSAEQAAPLFCAGLTVYRAVKNAQVSAGQRVGIFGVGGLGHLAVQLVKARGAVPIGFDVAAEKLAFARELGAAEAFDVTAPDLTKSVRALGGLHVAIVTSAAKAAYDTALKCIRPGGTLAVVGLPPEPLTFAPLALVGPEVRIVAASVGTRDDMRAVLELAAAGKLRCEIETVPLASVNETHARMVRGSIRGRLVLRCC